MLRGINVGGNKRIKMDDLRKSFEGLGFEQVKTYIQSGNVVFKAGKAPSVALGKKIEARIVSDFGFSVSVIVRTGADLGQTIAANPLFSASSLWKVPWEKALAVVTTTRNWKTVNALHQMCRDCE
jgi:uncharacterized protein (DUF1697 family)